MFTSLEFHADGREVNLGSKLDEASDVATRLRTQMLERVSEAARYPRIHASPDIVPRRYLT